MIQPVGTHLMKEVLIDSEKKESKGKSVKPKKAVAVNRLFLGNQMIRLIFRRITKKERP